MMIDLVDVAQLGERLLLDCAELARTVYPGEYLEARTDRNAYERGVIKAAGEIAAFVSERIANDGH